MIYLFSNTPKKDVKHIKIIDINFLRPTFTEDFNALIFTSKNAVIAFDKLNIKWKHIPSFAIGKATAKQIEKLDGKVEFTSQTSYGDEFAKEIKPLLKDKKILFPRAKEVITKIKDLLKPLHIKELIVYETKCVNCENFTKPLEKSTLIFTSPSSVKCFLKCFKLDDYKVICIGKKTAFSLPKHIKYKMPLIPDIDECIKLANL